MCKPHTKKEIVAEPRETRPARLAVFNRFRRNLLRGTKKIFNRKERARIAKCAKSVFRSLCRIRIRGLFSLRTAKRRFVCGKTEASPIDLRKSKTRLRIRADLVVQNRIVVEFEVQRCSAPCGRSASLIASSLVESLWLLINFHVVLLKDGIRRFVNDYQEHDLLEDELCNLKVRKVIAKRSRFFVRPLCASIAPFAVKSFP